MKKFFNILYVALLSTLFVMPVHSQDKKVIRIAFATPDSPTDPYAIGAHAFKAALAANPNGKIFDVQLYPNRQLGDEKAIVEGMKMGLVEASVVTNGVVAQMEPAFQLNDLPFLYTSSEQAYKLLDGPVGQELTKKLDAKGIVVLGYMGAGFRSMLNNVRPVRTPADVSGVKYRVIQSPIYISMFEALGGNPVPMAWGQTFTAVQQGTVDGLELPLSTVYTTKSYEIAKYLSLTKHTLSVLELLFSKKMLEKLPPEQQQAILDAGHEAIAVARKSAAEDVDQLVSKIKEKGMTVNDISDPAAFREKVKPVYEKFRSSIGSDLLDSALAQVK